jgi:hypothetical protein
MSLLVIILLVVVVVSLVGGGPSLYRRVPRRRVVTETVYEDPVVVQRTARPIATVVDNEVVEETPVRRVID